MLLVHIARSREEEGWAEATPCAKRRLRLCLTSHAAKTLTSRWRTALSVLFLVFSGKHAPPQCRHTSCGTLHHGPTRNRRFCGKATATARRHTAVPKMKTKTLRSWHIVSPTSSRSRRRWCSPMEKISFDSVPLTAAGDGVAQWKN